MKRNPVHALNRGSAMAVVIFAIAVSMVLSVAYLNRSSISLLVSGVRSDQLNAQYQMESAFELATARLARAVDPESPDPVDMELIAKLPHINNSLDDTNYSSLVDVYANDTDSAMQYLKDQVRVQALDEENNLDQSHEFYDFNQAFPSQWEDIEAQSNQTMQVRYEFHPSEPVIQSDPYSQIQFQYEYVIHVRAYGSDHFSESSSTETGLITIGLRQAPFSKYAMFRATNANQNDWLLVFAGGDSADEVQEIFEGPVHVNDQPFFWGSPTFMGLFTSTAPKEDWWEGSGPDYSGEPEYLGGWVESVDPIEMPTELANTTRLAAGDPDPAASVNTDPVTDSELEDFLEYYADGNLSGSVSPGVYIPVDDPIDSRPTGGIYVEGDAEVWLNVLEGNEDFPNTYWQHIDSDHRECKFQKIGVKSLEDSNENRDIFIGDDPCEVTYVFREGQSSPAELPRRLNGNVHVNGKIDKLGGESRTRPAVAQDFGFNISAKKNIRIYNDIQYEDALYVGMTEEGEPNGVPVANPWGEINASGYEPTSEDIFPTIDEDSKTVLGIMSTDRNVVTYFDHSYDPDNPDSTKHAPKNLNVHAAIYAGNSNAYDPTTELGCGEEHPGCGFGNEGYSEYIEDIGGQGSLKFLGSIAEYRSQTVGVITSANPGGYARRYTYDTRLLRDLTPPGFPLSTTIEAYPKIEPFKVWRLAGQD